MADSTKHVLDTIARLRQADEPFAVATIVRTKDATSAKAGAKAVVRRDGTLVGWIGGGCVQQAARRAAGAAITEGRARLIRVKPTDQVVAQTDVDGVQLHKSGCPSGGTVEIFVEPMLPSPQLVVCGASPVAQAISDLGRRMGYTIVNAALADDQPSFAKADHRVVGFDLSTVPRLESSYVVVATQGKRDREALGAALACDAPYVAFVGSRKKAADLRSQLAEQQFDAARLDRLRAPAGLDIGAIGPEEIALSILAQIVEVRRAGVRVEDDNDSVSPASHAAG